MSLFICEKCGSIENTALGHYWTRHMWTFQPTDSATGGYLDISVWRRVNGHDCLLCSRRIKHYSTKRRRDMRRAALGAAVVELRRLSRWAGERVAAIEAGEGDQG